MNLKTQLEQIISDTFLEEMIRIRQHLHRFPELSFQEHQTSLYIRKLLDSWGISYSFPWVETGILASITGGKPGPVIGGDACVRS
jgi:metal-dependent amidase/aminoacylase/carboxypeptidase family protein